MFNFRIPDFFSPVKIFFSLLIYCVNLSREDSTLKRMQKISFIYKNKQTVKKKKKIQNTLRNTAAECLCQKFSNYSSNHLTCDRQDAVKVARTNNSLCLFEKHRACRLMTLRTECKFKYTSVSQPYKEHTGNDMYK